jgi:Universal stress protein family
MRTEGVIVVGVDGSESARTLLEFALEEAARRSARVQAVIAFHTPVTWPGVWRMTPPSDFVPPSTEQLAEAAKPIIEQTVREVIPKGEAPRRPFLWTSGWCPDTRRRYWSTNPLRQTCSWWDTAGGAGSRACAWDRWGCSASCTRGAR